MGLLCCTFFDNRFLAKKIEKDQRLYYLDYYRGFTHTIVESHTKEKIFFLSLSLIRIFQRPRWPLGQRGSRPFFNYVDKILPIIDHIPKDQIKPNAVWACRRFCLKTNKRICFVYCEKQKNKQKKICLFVFWQNLWRVSLLWVLSDLYLQLTLVKKFLYWYKGKSAHC